MSVELKLKKLVDEGKTLHELHWNAEVVYSVMKDMSRSNHFSRAFESYFWPTINTWCKLYGSTSIPRHENMKVVVIASLALGDKPDTPDKLISGLSGFEEIKALGIKDTPTALFQNAFIYAIACCYKSQIVRAYMRATNEPRVMTEREKMHTLMGAPGNKHLSGDITYAAGRSDSEYVAYMESAHPLLATFVKSKNRFQYKKILPVIGYLVNPDLE